MGDVIHHAFKGPIRQAPTLVEEIPPGEHIRRWDANADRAEAFMRTPRGRFLTACQGLAEAGYMVTADDAIQAYRAGFQRLDRVPCPTQMAAAFGALASVPPNDAPAAQFARLALTALAAIALPFPETDQPKGVA